jgi:PIN domain nuclease of toxin-antitoxin system
VIVLDAFGLIAYFRGEPAAEEVAKVIRSGALLSAVNAGEVVDQLARTWARDPDDVEADLALLTVSGLTLVTADPAVGLMAGRLRSRHYHRERCSVSLADCIAAATALDEGVPLATADPALAALMRDEGGTIHPLPDTSGSQP